jgi:hypothetical protein
MGSGAFENYPVFVKPVNQEPIRFQVALQTIFKITPYSNFKSKRYLCWLRHRLLQRTIYVRLRRLFLAVSISSSI